ncbi:MAG TPA: STAS domain-containing protein [Pseudomonadales bacterium]|nr:STAS domain-containing protein [Pseudomonadales bacterium]
MGAKNNLSSYKLPDVVTIAEIEALHDALLALMSSDSPTLDASAVERIDTAALQQLVAFNVALQNINTELLWGACSDLFLASVEQIGLKDALGLKDQAA